MNSRILFLILRIIAAVILTQTLWFKFSAHPDSVSLFSEVSVFLTGNAELEAMIRISTGVIELAAALMLVWKKRAVIAIGALLSTATMAGAILTHFVIIGVAHKAADGTESIGLFIMACIVFLLSGIVLIRHWRNLPVIGKLGGCK
ncbi:MAG: DoxX family protein [Akkermansiaceae bacterium]